MRVGRFLPVCLVINLVFASCIRGGNGGAPSPDGRAAISFVDDDGRAVSLGGPAGRIISLYSAHTENLFALGAGDALIGGHTTCVYPPEAAAFAVYDYNGDPEYIIAAEPDLVLIRPFIRR
ncbi:MAG: hypothetical protein LBG57_11365, partial [Treponema sp.]|nr:hypothetical protein [Treponema sp.]